MSGAVLPEPATRESLAVLRSPDRRASWIVVLAATLDQADPNIERRISALHADAPIVGARLHREAWYPGDPPALVTVPGEPLQSAPLLERFRLAEEPPLRILSDRSGRRLVLAGHHAAFDGRGLVAVLAALLGGERPAPARSAPAPQPSPPWHALRRVWEAADRVAPSPHRPERDAMVARVVELSGSSVTARLAAACVAAAGARNRALGARWRRVGLSLGVGGPTGVGNVATYRRVDLLAGQPVEPAVAAALASPAVPSELVTTPRVARAVSPFIRRFSDSMLISNLGRVAVPGIAALEFFPVARGRSAVAFGAVGLSAGGATISIRARDLDPDDAENLLDAALSNFHRLASSG